MTSLSSYTNVRSLLLYFVILCTIVLFSVSLLPFIDLPNHLAEAAIYKYYDQPGNVISQYYKPTPWYFPNTFHTVFCSLFPTVELGNKVFHILCIALLHTFLFLIIKRLGGNPWYGLLGILFTFNYNVTFGFVGYAISIPAILIIFYLALIDFKEDRIYLKVLIALMLVLVFLMHAQNALFALLLYGCMALYKYRKHFTKLVAHGILIPLPLIVIIFSWWFSRGTENEESTGSYLLIYYQKEYLRSLLIRSALPFFDNFQLQQGIVGLALASVFFLCVVIPLLYFRPWQNMPMKKWLTGDAVYALIFFVVTFLCYLFLPDKLPGQTPLSQRVCTILMLSLIIVGSIWLGQVESKKLKYFVLAAAVSYTILWFEYLYTFDVRNKNFNREFFSGLDNKAKLTGLMYDNKYRGRKVFIHYPNYFLVWSQGIVTSKIIDYRFGVVLRVASETEIPFYDELIGEHYKPLRKYDNLDYILVRGRAPVEKDATLDNFTLLRQNGAWSLFKNKNLEKPSSYTLVR